MFPTSGFFRSHNCPYYLSGLCERPYCHFRHVKQQQEERPPAVHHPHSTARHSRRVSESQPSETIGADAPAATSTSAAAFTVVSTAPSTSIAAVRQTSSESEASDGNYTPTPLSVLRRTKERPESSQTSQPPPSTSAASASSPPAPPTRRRPLQLPAPKSGSDATSGTSASATAEDDNFYSPMDSADTEPAGPSKRSRCLASPPPESTADYEPTPIDCGGAYGPSSDGDNDDDDYCPTAVSAKPTVTVASDAGVPAAATVDGGTGIKRVFLDLFGEEPAASSAQTPTTTAAAPASMSGIGSLIPPAVRGSRPSPAEQLARRAQQAATNPSSLLSQGKVRTSVSSTPGSTSPASATPLAGSVANKIPELVRQRYLDRLAEECRLTGTQPDRAAKRAQELELECHERSANRNVYLNAVILAIKRVRASAETAGGEQSQLQRKQQAENASQLSDKRLHKHLMRYVLTAAQLVENKFPPNLPPLPYAAPVNPLERLCVRCGTAFLLQQPQLCVPPGQCCYHHGRAYSRRVPGTGVQQIYSCCGGDVQAKGCSLGVRHVHEYNVYHDTAAFRKTVEPDKTNVRKKQRLAVFALDCEMVYTEAGKELARVTVVDRNLSVVYDRLVQPSAPIVDCNTRFSGLKEEQLAAAEHRLADVQDELLQMVYSTCILIGHSLESDLQVLKLHHTSVVDTSIVFPHRLGLPKKRALRNLASEILNKIIQAGGDAGHDSSEDARTCMELMLYKLNEDLRKGKGPG